MRIAIITLGSRGDVQPFLWLARALADVGHEVTLGGPPNFSELARASDVTYQSVGYDTEAFHREAAAAKVIATGRTSAAFFGATLRRLQERQGRISKDAWEATRDADLLIYKSGLAAGPTIAEARGIPQLQVALQPMLPTAAFPPPLAGEMRDWGPTVNRVLGHVVNYGIDLIGRPGVRALRESASMRPSVHRGGRVPPTFCAFSPLVVPQPHDWPAQVRVTGYLFGPPSGYSPPSTLLEFLERGPAPICIGFGSMTHLDAGRMSEIVVRAVRDAGVRAILLQGWSDVVLPPGASEDIYVSSGAPHDWLYPRVRAVIHHGGAGTTAAALRAGVPALAIPHNFDQPFWGRRIHELGVAPPPLPLRSLAPDLLRDRICALVGDDLMRQRAESLGARIRREDGLGGILNWIERWGVSPLEHVRSR